MAPNLIPESPGEVQQLYMFGLYLYLVSSMGFDSRKPGPGVALLFVSIVLDSLILCLGIDAGSLHDNAFASCAEVLASSKRLAALHGQARDRMVRGNAVRESEETGTSARNVERGLCPRH